jgi:hypothetical protein
MTTFSTARITRRALLQTSSLHRSSSSRKQLSSSSLLLYQSATSTRRTMTTFPSLGNRSTVIRTHPHLRSSIAVTPSKNTAGNVPLFPSSRCSRAWMSTTPPGGDSKSASSSSSAKKEDPDEKTPSATSSSRSTPRRIVVRSQKKSNNNNNNNNDKKNSNNRANTETKNDDMQVQAELPKNVGYIYRRRKASHTGDSRNQHPSAATTTTSGTSGTSGGTDSGTSTSTSTTRRRRRPQLQQQHRQEQNSPSTETICDSSGVPVLIPGRERRPGPHSAKMHHRHHHRHSLSTINASALLNTKEYCLKSAAAATSNSGTEAARRLLRGKQDVVRILRQRVVYPRHNTNDTNETNPQQQNVHQHPYHHRRQHEPPVPHTLQGHGVPTQLLQNHLDLAGQLLELTGNASEVSFQNWSGELKLDWMRVRSQDGTSSVRPWPVVVPQSQDNGDDSGGTNKNNDTMASWDQEMALYLSVMNRLATQLSVVLQSQSPPTPPTPASTGTRTMTDAPASTITDEYSNVFSSFSSTDSQQQQQIPMHPPPPRYWNVKVWRGMAFAPDSLPAEPCPVVEWTPVQGLEAPGHVCIRIQGFPTTDDATSTNTTTGGAGDYGSTSSRTLLRRRQPQAVTLSFTACFRSNTTPSSSSSNGGNKRA